MVKVSNVLLKNEYIHLGSYDQECVIGPKVTNIHYGYKQYIEDKSILYSVIQLSNRVYNVTFPALAAES